MNKDAQEEYNNIDLDYLDDLSLGKAPDLKKSVSSPPPGFHFHDSSFMVEQPYKKEESKEFFEIMRQMKKFNPRLAEESPFPRKSSSKIAPEKTILKAEPIMNMLYPPSGFIEENSKEDFEKSTLNQFVFYGFQEQNIPENQMFFTGANEMGYGWYQPSASPHGFELNSRGKNDEDKRHVKIQCLAESKKRQAEYENGSKVQREEILNIALNELFVMIYDTYNNYIIQKIFEAGDIIHKKRLFERLRSKPLVEIAQHKFGCRIIQKTIEAFGESTSSEFQYLRNTIFHHLNELIWHENGTLVVQKCLEKYDSEDFVFILEYIKNNFRNLAYDKNGCLIIQKLIDVYPMKEKTNLKFKINDLISHIITHSFELSKKAYSNYIIQHLLESGHPEHKEKLLNQYVKPNFLALSCDQFASNVAEKSIINSDKDFRRSIWVQITKNRDEDFLKLVNDRYGNYVMQRIYEYADSNVKAEFEMILGRVRSMLKSQGNYVLKFVAVQNNMGLE